jgi:CRISPR/Cas system-associated endoribonuclease Cas2
MLAVTVAISAATGGSWTVTKIMERQNQRIQNSVEMIQLQKKRLDVMEDQVNRMPLVYVLKVDFLREIQEMQDNFRQINAKLDKLMEKILSK